MSLLSVLSVLVAAFCGIVAGTVALRGLGHRMNREFFLPVVVLMAFNVAQAFFFEAPDRDTAWWWHVFGSTCWAVVLALQLWLVMNLTRARPLAESWLAVVMAPAIVISVLLAMLPINEGVVVVRTPLGWSRDFSEATPWAWVVILSVAAYGLASLGLIARWWFMSNSRRARRQAGWILGSGIVAFGATALFLVNFPMTETPTIPQVPNLFAAIWVAGYGVAIRRHRLIPVTTSQAAGAILAGIQDLVLLLDERGRILEANPRAMGLLGYEPRALVGMAMASLGRDPGALRETLEQFLGRIEPERGVETLLVTREGEEVPVLVNGAAVLDREGDRVGIVVVVQDQRPMREVLKAERIESIGTLAGGIAHDFNNLLTAIQGFVSLAMMDAGDGGKVSERLGEASRACERAQGLTRQLLTFSRGGAPIRRATSLADVIRESASFVGAGSSARIEVDTAGDLWLADADAGQMGQVVHNLVLNAVQAMPDGGTVRLTASNVAGGESGLDGRPLPDDRVRLTVADEGVGIAADMLPRVFDPFFTTKQHGTGLGLATVYSIIRRHGGEIAIDSQVGRGTVVRIDLPRSRRRTAELPRQTGSMPTTSGRILLMDDQPGVRQVAEEMLDRLGFDVVTCADGEAALVEHRRAQAAGRPFDLAILDLTVPGGMGGVETLRHLRAVQPDIKAVVSSGYAPDAVMADYRGRGFDGVLPKPYSLERLQRVVERVLRGRRGGTTTGEYPVRIPEAP